MVDCGPAQNQLTGTVPYVGRSVNRIASKNRYDAKWRQGRKGKIYIVQDSFCETPTFRPYPMRSYRERVGMCIDAVEEGAHLVKRYISVDSRGEREWGCALMP